VFLDVAELMKTKGTGYVVIVSDEGDIHDSNSKGNEAVGGHIGT